MRRVLLVIAALVATIGIGAGFFVVLYKTATPSPEWYAQAQRLDPIFAIAGTDPALLRNAVNSLITQQREIAGHFAGPQAGQLQQSLYPTDFLPLLANLEEARQALLKNPSLENANTYHTTLLATIAAYQHDAENLATAMVNSTDPTFTVGFLEGTTTMSYIASQLRAAAADAALQQNKEEARYNCMQHYRALLCQSTRTLAHMRDAKLNTTLSTLPAPTSSVEVADSLVKKIIQYSYPHLQNLSPLIALSTPCFPYPTTYARTWQFNALDGNVAFKSYIANDAYFYDVAQLLNSPSMYALYHTAQKMGAVYEYQNIANYYMCPDAGLYLSDISRVIGVRELAQEASTTAAAQLLSLPMLQLSDAASFAQSSGSDETIERYLEGSANLDQTIETLINDNVYILSLLNNGGSMEPSFLFLSRSYPSVLFMLGNPTFVSKPISFFQYRGHITPDPALRSWNNKLSKKVGVEEILTQAKKSIDIFRVLSGR